MKCSESIMNEYVHFSKFLTQDIRSWALLMFLVSLVRLVVVSVAAELVGIWYLLIRVVLFVLN